MTDLIHDDHSVSIRAEQHVLGALLVDNDAFDRITDLGPAQFYRNDHRLIFAEMMRQSGAGHRFDPMTLTPVLDRRVENCLQYLVKLRASAVSAVNIRRHAEIIIDKAAKRALFTLSVEMGELAASAQPAAACIDVVASRLDMLAQARTSREPERLGEMMSDYADLLERRMAGAIRPVRTGYRDLDEQLDGGLERGTLTVVAARPGMGKTAFGLGVARNASADGVALFYSMEMSREQVTDRNVSAIGRIPLAWLRKPGEGQAPNSADRQYWDAMGYAFTKAADLNLVIDVETGLNTMEIRAKARKTKRKEGALDVIVIDQLSFITGGQSEKSYEVVGEHTRALVALAKEIDCAVILLCQLNRECEKRPNKRPIMADLALSGSIEQDAANIIFLYRDEKYNEDTPDKGVCEVNCEKLRQGRPGVVGLQYVGPQTRFEDLAEPWYPQRAAPGRPAPRARGFGFGQRGGAAA
nr:DnaB-like helicase C-terminal domain-containing protein [uncultured Massilia sp.]